MGILKDTLDVREAGTPHWYFSRCLSCTRCAFYFFMKAVARSASADTSMTCIRMCFQVPKRNNDWNTIVSRSSIKESEFSALTFRWCMSICEPRLLQLTNLYHASAKRSQVRAIFVKGLRTENVWGMPTSSYGANASELIQIT